MHDAQTLRVRLLAFSTVFNIAANLLVIPVFGSIRAAWIIFVTESMLMLWYGLEHDVHVGLKTTH
jgi:O-antigen/teichoic acid export membrane protein